MPIKAKILKSAHFARMNEYLDNNGITEILHIIKSFRKNMFLCRGTIHKGEVVVHREPIVEFEHTTADFDSDADTVPCDGTSDQLLSLSKTAKNQRRYRRNIKHRTNNVRTLTRINRQRNLRRKIMAKSQNTSKK